MGKHDRNIKKQNISPEEIAEDLTGYELVKDYMTLREYDRIKYLRKDSGSYIKGGLLILGNLDKGYIVLQSFKKDWKTNRYLRFSITLSDVILFRKKD